MPTWISPARLAILAAIDHNGFMVRIPRGYRGAVDALLYSVGSIELVCHNQWAEFSLSAPCASVSLNEAGRRVLAAGVANLTPAERKRWPRPARTLHEDT